MPNEPKANPEIENNILNPAARRNARRYALQALYQWQMADTSMNEIEAEFLQYHIDKKIDMDYFKELIHGVLHHQHEIDKEIKPLITRSFTEMDAVELAAIRLATYELLHRPDVPFRVVINEALELTKKFGSVEGFKFVNGVLDKAAKKIRTVESNNPK